MLVDYRGKYLELLCEQNQSLFDSSFYWQFVVADLPLDPRKLQRQAARTFLEIGFGHGEVLEELVQRHRDTAFVGIERRPARVRKALKRLQRIGGYNARLLRANLELIERPLFVPGAFDEILINHPDPWSKRRHQPHRLFQRKIMDGLADLLAPGGSIEVTSDHTVYFFQILQHFETDNRFENCWEAPGYTDQPVPQRPVSRFEKMKRAGGESVRLLRFRKKG